jgi:hypothetical protein
MIRVVSYLVTGFGVMTFVFIAWILTLPRLDPTGNNDSAPAIRAMIEGRPVLNLASGWPMTRTGWPFFESYSPAPK